MTTCEFFFFPSKYGDLFIFFLKQIFCSIGTELFLNRHSAKIRQNTKKKNASSPSPPSPLPFFYPISKWLNFAEPKITLRVEPRENDGEEDEA